MELKFISLDVADIRVSHEISRFLRLTELRI